MRRLAYYNTFFKTTSPPTAALAARLAALMPAGLDRVLFAHSGSEALDSIVRLSRHFWALEGRPEQVVMIGREEGYHGSTRSDERRVGKEWGRTGRSRWWPENKKEK